MKPYQIKLTYKGKKYQFAMLSNADDIEQSLRERFPGCECEVVGPDKTQKSVDRQKWVGRPWFLDGPSNLEQAHSSSLESVKKVSRAGKIIWKRKPVISKAEAWNKAVKEDVSPFYILENYEVKWWFIQTWVSHQWIMSELITSYLQQVEVISKFTEKAGIGGLLFTTSGFGINWSNHKTKLTRYHESRKTPSVHGGDIRLSQAFAWLFTLKKLFCKNE